MPDPYTVELPAEMKPLLETEAKEHGFPDVAAYVAALVRANAPADDDDPALEAALIEGLESGPPQPVNAAYWVELRRRVRAEVRRPQA